jgi:apolipoprotein N-acyltransferase
LLVNVTNDAWFGRTGTSEQQFDEAVFRTVENRRPLVRCANTGLTGFIDQDGRVTQTLRFADGTGFGAGVLSGEVNVPLNPTLTFYTLHGEVFSIGCAEAAALAALFALRNKLRRRRPRTPLPAPALDELQPAP